MDEGLTALWRCISAQWIVHRRCLVEQSWLACEEELICDPCGWVALVLEETIISFSMP